jgi:cytochrome c556
MMKRVVLAVAVAALGVTAVLAQSDPIAARKAIMKENNNQGRILRDMADGKRPFDLTTAKKAFATFQSASAKLPDLFPESSKVGDTRALPTIWEKSAEFKAAAAKFGSDAKAAEASTKDMESLKTAFAEVGKNCGSCHQNFRKPQS